MLEPGLDRHDWETQWQALEPLIADSPAEALPEVVALVERIAEERGVDPDDDSHHSEDVGELVLEIRNARELARTLEAGEDVAAEDVDDAIEALKRVYDVLLDGRRAP